MLLMPQSDAFQSGPGVLLRLHSVPNQAMGRQCPLAGMWRRPRSESRRPLLQPRSAAARAQRRWRRRSTCCAAPARWATWQGLGGSRCCWSRCPSPRAAAYPGPSRTSAGRCGGAPVLAGGSGRSAGAAQGPPHHPAAARACHRPARSRAAKHGAWAGMQRRHGREPRAGDAERVRGQGVAGFEDLLKALERHGGALSVLTWRRSGMQTHQANRFIAMFAVAQARAQRAQRAHPARRPALSGHTVSHAAAVGRHLSSDGATRSAILPLFQPSTVRPCIDMH